MIVKRKRGPRKRKPTGELLVMPEGVRVLDANLIEQAAGLLSDKQLLAFFNMTAEEWEQMCSAHPHLLGAPERGRARKTFEVAKRLMDRVEEGNLDAIKFYLKCRGGYREDGENVHIGSLGAITSINITAKDSVEAAQIYQDIMKGA